MLGLRTPHRCALSTRLHSPSSTPPTFEGKEEKEAGGISLLLLPAPPASCSSPLEYRLENERAASVALLVWLHRLQGRS